MFGGHYYAKKQKSHCRSYKLIITGSAPFRANENLTKFDQSVVPLLLKEEAYLKKAKKERKKERRIIGRKKMWQRSHKSCSEERELELRLGPPGEESLNEKYTKNVKKERDTKGSSFLQLSSVPVMGKDASKHCCVDLQVADKNSFSPSSSNSAVPNRSQKRSAAGPVVGWPPIRSFRKNIASGSTSKPPTGSHQDKVASSNKPIGNSGSKGLFVKINMDGVPIGRKVDINAYGSYEKLSSAVDKLFRSLLEELNLSHIVSSHGCSAQRDSSAGGTHKKQEEDKAITGSLIGSGEYTLVYEDIEGDKMLVGDVPWHMFISTVKRLRVLKSSDLPAFNLGNKQE